MLKPTVALSILAAGFLVFVFPRSAVAQRRPPLVIDVPQDVAPDSRAPLVNTTKRAKIIDVGPGQFVPNKAIGANPASQAAPVVPPTDNSPPVVSRTEPSDPLQPRGDVRAFAGVRELSFPQDAPRVEVPLFRGGNLLFVRAQINDGEAGLFLVDTGAATTIIDIDVASRLRLPIVGEGAALGVGGSQFAEAVGIQQLVLGMGRSQVKLGKHIALTVDLGKWRRAFGGEFYGLLGATLWGQAPFTIDYRTRLLTFHQRRFFQPPAGLAPDRLHQRNGHPAVLGILNDHFTSFVEIDTGHEYSLDVDTQFVARNAKLFDRAKSLPSLVQGIGGSAERWTTTIDSLSVFGRRIEKVPVTFGKIPDPKSSSSSAAKGGPPVKLNAAATSLGILGGRELRNFRITFDYQGEKIFAQPQPDNPLLTPTGSKADPNKRDALGIPPLVLAVRNRDLVNTQALLEAGAKVNEESLDGSTPLAIAVSLLNAELVDLLLKHGADANGRTKFDEWPILHALSDKGELSLVATLLENGADVDLKGRGGVTPLMLASLRGHDGVVKLLVAKKANANAVDVVGQTPLHFAVEKGNAQGVQLLLAAGANPNVKSNGGRTPIAIARQNDRSEIADLLLAAGAKE